MFVCKDCLFNVEVFLELKCMKTEINKIVSEKYNRLSRVNSSDIVQNIYITSKSDISELIIRTLTKINII